MMPFSFRQVPLHWKIQLPTPQMSATIGGRAFAFTAPNLWNKLPTQLRNTKSLQTYKSLLKASLFAAAFGEKCWVIWAHKNYFDWLMIEGKLKSDSSPSHQTVAIDKSFFSHVERQVGLGSTSCQSPDLAAVPKTKTGKESAWACISPPTWQPSDTFQTCPLAILGGSHTPTKTSQHQTESKSTIFLEKH
jgi:hypothetical protein